jgi:hypothetical protein
VARADQASIQCADEKEAKFATIAKHRTIKVLMRLALVHEVARFGERAIDHVNVSLLLIVGMRWR